MKETYSSYGEYFNDFYKENEAELKELFAKYKREGKHLPGNTWEEVDSLETWLEKLRRGEEK